MKVWIDLANSPHVGFFLPIIRQFEADGHEVVITIRDFAQTVELCKRNGIEGTVIDGHGGRSRLGKLSNLIARTQHLVRFIKPHKVDVAVSHNSYTQILAARLAGIRTVTIMDYEGQPANHLAFRMAHKVIVPESFPEESLRHFGAAPRKVYKYKGFKEQVYLSDFKPVSSFYEELRQTCDLNGWQPDGHVLVTVRTPATMAAYHRFENPLFDDLLARIQERPELTVVVLPRTRDQREELRQRFPNVHIPSRPLDGNNLVYHSDLVISAGGTMNREAAILGTPAYTIFAGKIPAVDRRLIERGKMHALENRDHLGKIKFTRKQNGAAMRNPGLCRDIVQQILM